MKQQVIVATATARLGYSFDPAKGVGHLELRSPDGKTVSIVVEPWLMTTLAEALINGIPLSSEPPEKPATVPPPETKTAEPSKPPHVRGRKTRVPENECKRGAYSEEQRQWFVKLRKANPKAEVNHLRALFMAQDYKGRPCLDVDNAFVSWFVTTADSLIRCNPMREASIISLAERALLELGFSPMRFEQQLHRTMAIHGGGGLPEDFTLGIGGSSIKALDDRVIRYDPKRVKHGLPPFWVEPFTADGIITPGCRTVKRRG